MKVLIASPSYDGSVRAEYMRSVMGLTDYFRSEGIEWEMLLEKATLLHVMRGFMASKVVLDEGFTHLLFIDTDMAFPISAVKRMVAADVDVIGCAYPYRTIPLHEEIEANGVALRRLISETVPYAVYFAGGAKEITVTRGLCEVAAIGTGLMLVARDALVALSKSDSVQKFALGFPYTQWTTHSFYYGFFDYLQEDGACLGEDISFCRRWTGLGGKIHALCDEEIFHIGPIPVAGRYTDRLRAGRL